MAPSMSLSKIHYASFNAVEVKIRSKFSKEIPEEGLTSKRRVERRSQPAESDLGSSSTATGEP